ncbi:unnamed protein product [Sphagnum balticum]
MPVPLWWHSAVAIDADTTALVCGGQTSAFANTTQSACYAFSLLTGVWTLAAPMNTARYAHGMQEYCRRVFVYGGMDANGQLLASVEMLSPDRHNWTTMATSMFAADAHFASVPLPFIAPPTEPTTAHTSTASTDTTTPGTTSTPTMSSPTTTPGTTSTPTTSSPTTKSSVRTALVTLHSCVFVIISYLAFIQHS